MGNGENILIYNDSWLPNPQYPRIQSPLSFYSCDAQVSILIDKERRCWIKEAVDNNFLAYEAKLIKAIPLSTMMLKTSCVGVEVWMGCIR